MNAGLIQVGLFLLNTVFSLYITAVMLRFLLQWVKADFYNPLCQFIMKVTNPLLLPLRRLIPGWFGLDLAAVVLILALQILEISLMNVLIGLPVNGFIIIAALIKILLSMLNLYFYLILVRAVLSWVSPYQANPIQVILLQLTEPVLRPIRNIIKPIHGFDLSPIVVLILIQAILIFIRNGL